MSTFNAINKVPGVYIDEVLVAGSIAGVATSILGIVGPARRGRINRPMLVTNFTQFTNEFGGHFASPVFYSSHAVQGFFANGGSSCYFVRVATAVRSSRSLADRSPGANTTLVVTARTEGLAGDQITVDVQDAHIVPQVQVVRNAATTSGAANAGDSAIGVDDASGFRAGDPVLLNGGGNSETGSVASTDTAANTVTLVNPLGNGYPAGSAVRIADLTAADTRLRVADSAGVEPGSYVEVSQTGNPTSTGVVEQVDTVDHVLTLAQGLGNGYSLDAADPVVDLRTLEFTLVVHNPAGNSTQTFADLSMDPRHSRYYASNIDALHVEVTAPDPPNVTAPVANLPAVAGPAALAGGVNDNPSNLSNALYMAAIDSLESVDAVTMLCVPDRINQPVQGYMIAHCERMQDRFAILDPERNAEPANGIRTQRQSLASDRGYGALYYPWISIADPNSDGSLLVPPSGHIAGVFARTDDQKGVHKAPANEQIVGVLDLQRTLNDTEAGQLNELSVNVLRRIPNRGFRIWGARTLSARTQWRYVNVRRLLLFIEESIQEGTQDSVFEPNNPALWETVKRQVSDFLTKVWRSGALFGTTPEEAFRVRVDEELNPPSVIALGQLIFEVRLRPTTPAEFIVFRVIQDPSRSLIEE